MMLKYPPVLLTSLLLGAMPALAIEVELSESAPADNIIKYNDVTTGTLAGVNSYWRQPGKTDSKVSYGQGFSTTDLDSEQLLSAVTFYVYDYSPEILGLAFSLTITETSKASTKPSDMQNVSFMTTESGVLPEAMESGRYITFTLDTPVTLKMGKYYNVVFSFDELTSQDSTIKDITFGIIDKGTPGTSNTTGGMRWNETDGVFATGSAINGLVFYAHAAPIPENNTALLLGLGVASLVFTRFRLKARA